MPTWSRRPTVALAALAAALTAALAAQAPSAPKVDQAYEELGHRHAAIDPTSRGFSREEGVFLSRLFELVDLAIVEKSEAWTWFQSEGRKGSDVREYRQRIDALILRLDGLPAPDRLRDVQRLLVAAIREQRAFFEAWDRAMAGGGGDDPARGKHLQDSSAKLHQAYDALLHLFPDAGQQNFDAFYDHLCVLDLL